MTKEAVEIARWLLGRVLASLRDAGDGGILTGGIASLNHRLIAWNPPGSRRRSHAISPANGPLRNHAGNLVMPEARLAKYCIASGPLEPHADGMIAPQSLTCESLSGPPPHHAEGIEAISRWSRSEATVPPVWVREMVRIPEGCQRHRSWIWGTIRAANQIHRCPFVIFNFHRAP